MFLYLLDQIPLLLRQDIYASAAIAGIVLYLAQDAGPEPSWAFGTGLVAVAALRLSAIFLGWNLPVFKLSG